MRAVHRSHPSVRICPSWNAPAPDPRVLRASVRWNGVLSRRFCQALLVCAPEAARTWLLTLGRIRVATHAVAPLGLFGIKDLDDLFLIKKLSHDDLAFQQFDNLAISSMPRWCADLRSP